MTRSLEEGSLLYQWTRVKKAGQTAILMYHSVHNMAESEAANAKFGSSNQKPVEKAN